MSTSKKREPKYTIEEALEWLGEVPDANDAVYDFGNTSVLLTHPAINEGEAIQGYFSGNWTTHSLSRSTFEIVEVAATIVLPSFDLKLPKYKSPIRTFPGSVLVNRGHVEVPNYLKEVFPNPNEGTVDVRNRFYQTVFGMQVHFAYVYGDSKYLDLEEPADLLLKTIGKIEKGGELTASGTGIITSGFFSGAMFSCSHGSKKKTKSKKCGAKSPTGYLCTRKKHTSGNHSNPTSGERW